jgi:hypothetical protein
MAASIYAPRPQAHVNEARPLDWRPPARPSSVAAVIATLLVEVLLMRFLYAFRCTRG